MTLFNVRSAKLIVPGFHPDPSICEAEKGHYVLTFSSFEYFPGLPVYESFDEGKTWSFCSHVAARPEQFTSTPLGNSQGFYAPTIRYHAGTYYLIVTDVNRGAMIFTTHDLHGQWSDPMVIEGWPGIDPSLLFLDAHESGSGEFEAYICGNEAGNGSEKPGIYAARINPDTAQLLSDRHFLIGGITGSNPEGPHMYKRGNTFYLMWAEGGTEAGHMECIARSQAVFGPYEANPDNPILTNRSTHLSPQCIGHADFAPLDEQRSLLVFLGLRTNASYPQQGFLGREAFLSSFTWNDESWPDLKDQSFEVDPADNGSVESSRHDWICPGVDRDQRFHVSLAETSSDGSFDSDFGGVGTQIRITANAAVPAPFNYSEVFAAEHGPRLIGRRQLQMDDSFTVDVVSPVDEGWMGLAVYANRDVWAQLMYSTETQKVQLITNDHGLIAHGHSFLLNNPEGLRLQVHSSEDGYRFYASDPSKMGECVTMGFVPCQIFAATSAGGFTGTLLSAFAHGKGEALFNVSEE